MKILKLVLIFFLVLSLQTFGQDSKYRETIKSADTYFNKGDYMNAKAAYQYALRFKKEDEYATKRIDECIRFMNSQSGVRLEYSKLLQEGDFHFKKKEYKLASTYYKQALTFFSNEEYPQKQIQEINRLIHEEAELTNDYNQAITAGDRYFKLKRYANARLEYQYALGLKSEKLHPKQRLEEIALLVQDLGEKRKIYDETLTKANDFFNRAQWEKALENYQLATKLFPEEDYPKQKINELNPLIEQLEKYRSIILAADEFYIVKDLENAKEKYQQAAKIKPSESYPKEMLDKVNLAIETKATTEQQDFDNAVKLGNQHIAQQQWKDAKIQFEFANRLKPNEAYPKQKLTEIAGQIKIVEAEAERQHQYEEFIKNADLYFIAKDYEQAKINYTEAQKLFPENNYPEEKISAITKIQTEIQAEKELLANYQAKITEAENLLKQEKYVNAKLAFEQAKDLKPEEKYPIQKLTEINSILDRIAAEQTAEQNYQNSISLADTYFKEDKLIEAQSEYRKALGYKNNEDYPQQQLVKIKDIFEQRAIAVQKAYDAKIKTADSLFLLSEYKNAIAVLNEASSLKPNEAYPKQKTAQINRVIEENYHKAKAEYDKLIAEANDYFKAKVYEKALHSYQEANRILLEEQFAISRINEITEMFEAATLVVINNQNLAINDGEQKRLNFTPIPIKDRKSNYIYILVKSAESTGNLRLFVNYGKDDTKNGGVIIRLNSTNQSMIHLVRVGTQYKWFSEDNNWVNLQVFGGKVKVELVKVSKGILI